MPIGFTNKGADGILFYDYVIRFFDLQWEVYRELGNPERLRYANKVYVYQLALPLALGYHSEGGKAEMEIDLPDDLAGTPAEDQPVRARLLLNITGLMTSDDITLQINGQKVTVGPEQSITTPAYNHRPSGGQTRLSPRGSNRAGTAEKRTKHPDFHTQAHQPEATGGCASTERGSEGEP